MNLYTPLKKIHTSLNIGNDKSCYKYNWNDTLCCINCNSKNDVKHNYIYKDNYNMKFNEALKHIINGSFQLNKILSNKQNKKVLVHCRAGINRCATICGAYAILYLNWSADKAINYIRNRNKYERNLLAITNPVFEKILYYLSNQQDKSSYHIQYINNNKNIKFIHYNQEEEDNNYQTQIKDIINK